MSENIRLNMASFSPKNISSSSTSQSSLPAQATSNNNNNNISNKKATNLAPIILVNSQQQKTLADSQQTQISSSTLPSSSNYLSSNLNLPNTGSFNSSLTTSISSSISVSSSPSSSTNNLTTNLTNQQSVSTTPNTQAKFTSNHFSLKNPTSQMQQQINAINFNHDDDSNNNNNNNNSSLMASSSISNQTLENNQQQQQNTTCSNYYNDQQIGHGHFFTKKNFHKPTNCHHCTEMLWGLITQGFVCEVCNFICHEKCQKSVVSPCTSIAHSLIKNPVPHCWSEPTHLKKKFCNICRKRLDDHLCIRCEICEYYLHLDCQVLAVNDCCETATYVPNRDLKSITHNHHWREGNLPNNSKCIVCKKTCSSVECLAGMKCEWCGVTTHSICRSKLIEECNFGNLRDIIVPPFAVSVPRIDMNKEAILGIQSSRPKTRSFSAEWSANQLDFKSDLNSDISGNYVYYFPTSQQSSNQASSNSTNDNSTCLVNNSNSNANNSNLYSQTNSNFASTQSTTTISNNTNDNNNNNNNNVSIPVATSSLSKNHETISHTNVSLGISSGSKKKDKIKQQTENEEEKEILKVYDGNTSFRKRIFRKIAVNKNYSYLKIVESALRTFHINDDPKHYYLSVPLSASNTPNTAVSYSSNDEYQIEELLVDETNPIKSIKTAIFNANNLDGPKASILLRYKENSNKECIRIYPGIIKETTCYQTVNLNLKSTVLETIEMALEKFQINNNSADKFSLVEVLLDQDVKERVLNSNDYPLQLIRKLRKESLCNNRMVRFYLQQKEDPHGPSVALFVGNLPSGLSQIQYEKIIMDMLKNNNEIRWNKFDVIYYEYGSMVILYEESEKAVKAYKLLKDSFYENKQLMVLLLPTIQHLMIPANVCPLLVFVNVKSGGQQGAELITSFRHLLNPHQVFDLQNGGPLPGLYVFRNIESYRIIACGGDGTIGWILSCLDNVSQDAKCQSPPMAIVPLGTGNDLARVLRWGAGYTGAEEPINLLRDVIDADEITLDRWTVVFHSDENKELDDIKRLNVNQANTNEDNTEIYVMNNYFGIGIEADVCLDFHTAREENPNKFNSRLHNKKYYVQLGIRKMINRGSCRDFNRFVTLEVDGKRIDLPHIEGIIILNILSWGSGTNPWGPEKDDQFQKPTHYDGMLEVVGIRGIVHMGQIQGGLSSAIRIAQGGRIKIRMNAEMPVHVDGEPWLQSPCAITILKSALKATMLKKSKMKIKRRNTESNVNLAANNGSPTVTPKVETSSVDPEGESDPF